MSQLAITARRVLRWARHMRPVARIADRLPFRVEFRRPSRCIVHDADRVAYQRKHVDFDIRPGDRILDIGCGAYPFPGAAVSVDRFPGPTHHRHQPLKRDGTPFVVADVGALPFPDGHFDYVYCSHVLEHVPDPIAACREIMRVGKRGYIETPTLAKDMLFAWADGMHTWHVVSIGNTLCFFEYSSRQLKGIGSQAWSDEIFCRWWNPLQDAFDANQDLFNVMFQWSARFEVAVFDVKGGMRGLGPA